FGEYPRTYGPGGPAPVLELAARYRREDPIAQTILSGGREHFLLGGLPRAAMAAFTSVTTLKHVVIVDEDVDAFDSEQVEWAIATRTQADRDLLVIPRTLGSSLDPSAEGSTTAKLVIDATVPPGRHDRHARMRSAPALLGTYLAELADQG